MPRHAFILGGTGQIGRAVADALASAGWEVTMASRRAGVETTGSAPGQVRTVTLDRDRPGDLAHALGNGADVLIDVTAYDAAHGAQLLELQRDVGALVVISSSSVYRDAQGRTLDEAARNSFPLLPDPINEAQPTVEPGPATYSTRKVELERVLLDRATIPVTVLRPAAVHGPGSIHPREWWLVKRMLDRRPFIPLAYEGESRFHTSATANIAALVRAVLDRPGTRILNIADPVAVSVADIAREIAAHLGYAGRIVPVATEGFPARIGRTPWSVQHPFVLDTAAAAALGYLPVIDYPASVASICDDLIRRADGQDWRSIFPLLAGYPHDQFDYRAEDAVLGLG